MAGIAKICGALLLLLSVGCVTGLNSIQHAEYKAYEARGQLIEEDSTTAAGWWGLLFGGGSFYTGNTGYGVANLLLWPLSMMWDPVSGVRGAEVNNYTMTRQHMQVLENRELDDLDAKLRVKSITMEEYTIDREGIKRRYRVP